MTSVNTDLKCQLFYARLSTFMKKMSFYSGGLKFSCTRCSSCCRYDSGFVYLSENDLQKLISALNINRNTFIKTYCRWVSDMNGNEVLSLKEKSNNDCILWETSGCAVYSARPAQCISFPFWENILASKKNWELAASGCPGINSGKTYTEIAINEILEMRVSEPLIYRTV